MKLRAAAGNAAAAGGIILFCEYIRGLQDGRARPEARQIRPSFEIWIPNTNGGVT